MINLNISEKRIIFRILNLIMKADCVINPAEVEYLDKIFDSFQMELSEFDHMEDVELEELINGFSLFPDETKEYAKKCYQNSGGRSGGRGAFDRKCSCGGSQHF